MPLIDNPTQTAPTVPSRWERGDALAAARERAARTLLGLSELLAERPELRGGRAGRLRRRRRPLVRLSRQAVLSVGRS